MKDLTNYALNLLNSKNIAYSDIRIVKSEYEGVSIKNQVAESVGMGESHGFSIKVLKDGAWGFAASNNLTKEGVRETAEHAIQVAEASAHTKDKPVILDNPRKIVDTYSTNVDIDPFSISLEEKLKVMSVIEKEMRRAKGVTNTEVDYAAYRNNKIFASSEGSYIEQTITECGGGITATSTDGKDVQVRSFPNSFKGQYKTGGFEVFKEQNLKENAQKIAEESVALLSAPQCPSGEKTIILDGNQLGLQVHESCGHPIELDRVFGMEAGYAGTSFLTEDKLGKFQYGSKYVNIVADATTPGGLGTFGYDDEGVPAQRTQIIENGKFVGYLTSRETAPIIGQQSNGTSRADGWSNLPIIRMTNINLEPGEWTLEGLISDTKDGIFMSTNHEWSIDDKRLNFQFGCEIAWEIKNGKLGRILKNPNYQDETPRFWNSCDAVCNKDYWHVWGTPNCGKGQPGQVAHVGHGVAPARFNNVKVGVGKW